MNLFKSITLITTVIFFAACTSSKTPHKMEDENKIENPVSVNVLKVDPQLQNGKTINLKVNDKFDVAFLHECVGCAEVWTITNINKDKILQMESSYENGPGPHQIGGSRDHIFHFMVKEKGVSTISFTYFDKKSTITFDIN